MATTKRIPETVRHVSGAEWTRFTGSGGGWCADHGGWGLRVYLDDDAPIPDPDGPWVWSAMRFAEPHNDANDDVIALGGNCRTDSAAMRAAVRASTDHDAKEN